MIRLFAENPDQANPNLALRWCVDKKTLDELKEKGVKNPQLLLVVVRYPRDPSRCGTKEIERKLVSLDRAMEWLEFNRPGRYTIYTTIVWDDGNSWDFAVGWLLMKDGSGSFKREIFDCDGKFSRTRNPSVEEHSLDEGSLDVVVAEELFAKEPPAWLNWWVNLWFKAMEISRPTNQCSFRRRAILAFTIQPIPVLVYVLLKSPIRLVVALVLVLCGMRGVSFKPVIHPFKLLLDNVWYDVGSSVFLKNKEGEWRFAYVVGLVNRGLQAIWRALAPPPIAEELERRQQVRRERTERKAVERALERQKRERKKLEALYKGFQDVVCIGVPLKPKLELLPEKRRTIYLRYMDLKAKVCKPYAR